jgi:hypothetical protein
MHTIDSYRNVLIIILLLTVSGVSIHVNAEMKPDKGSLVYLEFIDAAPFYYKQGGTFQGSTVDMVRILLEPLDHDVTIQVMSPERVINEALVGKGDVLMLHTFLGLTLEDYPDGMLICPHKISRVPIHYYTNNIHFTHARREEVAASRIGVLRYASFQRGFTRKQELSNITRFNGMKYMYRAMLANRVDVVIAGPYSMRVMALEHETLFPYELDVDLGYIEGYLAVTKKAEQRLGIYQALCEQAARWNVDEDFVESVGRHLKAYGDYVATDFSRSE